MFDYVEPRVRGLVAEYLGVREQELTPDVSLVDDLAADSLDLVELAVVLEGQFGIAVPESVIERIRTYGDLVDTVHALAREREERVENADDLGEPALVWARILPPPARHGDIQRAGWLTPYTAETITEDVLRIGPGAQLDLSVPETVSDRQLSTLEARFAWLAHRGIALTVRRDHHLNQRPATPHHRRPDAAA